MVQVLIRLFFIIAALGVSGGQVFCGGGGSAGLDQSDKQIIVVGSNSFRMPSQEQLLFDLAGAPNFLHRGDSVFLLEDDGFRVSPKSNQFFVNEGVTPSFVQGNFLDFVVVPPRRKVPDSFVELRKEVLDSTQLDLAGDELLQELRQKAASEGLDEGEFNQGVHRAAQVGIDNAIIGAADLQRQKVEQRLKQLSQQVNQFKEQADQAIGSVQMLESQVDERIKQGAEAVNEALRVQKSDCLSQLKSTKEDCDRQLAEINQFFRDQRKEITQMALMLGGGLGELRGSLVAKQQAEDLYVLLMGNLMNDVNDLEHGVLDSRREVEKQLVRVDTELEHVKKEIEKIKANQAETIFAFELGGFSIVSFKGRNTWSAASQAYLACFVSCAFNRLLPQLTDKIPVEAFGASGRYVSSIAGMAAVGLFAMGTSIATRKAWEMFNKHRKYLEEEVYPPMQPYLAPAVKWGIPVAGIGAIGAAIVIGHKLDYYELPSIEELIRAGGILTDRMFTHVMTKVPEWLPQGLGVAAQYGLLPKEDSGLSEY